MIKGFSIEFKPWYITVRSPRGRVYLAIGFSKHVPVYNDYPYYLFTRNTTSEDDDLDC